MSTSRDLLIATLDAAPAPPVGQGDLSLALAGAELLDLLDAQALDLDGDLIVPRARPALDDRLLDAAADALRRQTPYESVEDWLWRRGRGLYTTYFAALEQDRLVTRQRHPRFPIRTGRTELVDSPERRRAADRWESDEPVLAALAAAIGLHDDPAEDFADRVTDAVVAVVATVNDAVMELEATRRRREIEEAAFDNVWRAP
ncbi:GPP34 family phosphoprotein [Streptomyces sp. NPDC026672]|uniref:GPP34 family phosphoprotein n=1 Tax=unclassified Streptomyces TaxID=2593676 RepID=UPI0033D0C74E